MKHVAYGLIVLGLLLGLAGDLAAAEKAKRPNFVLLMADDQGWGDVSYNGNERIKTPVLDEMARTGLRFDRFYAAAPVCSPTRGSVLTGRHPNRFGCFQWGHVLRPQEVTVAEVLQKAGYTTGHFGKWHLGSVRKGSLTSPSESGFDEFFSSPNFFENNPLMSENGEVVQTDGESSLVTVYAALDFIRQANRQEQPFLAVVWFGSPHTPHIAGPREKKIYEGLPSKDQNYLGEVTGIDYAVGVLRDELKELGLTDSTLVWYTSDNGARAPGSTGGLRGQKGSLWEGGIRVPTIIEWPSVVKQPRHTDIACGSVDIYPTLLELAGAQAEDQPPLDGQSLVPLLVDGELRERKPLGFWVYPIGGRPVRSSEILRAQSAEAAAGELQKDFVDAAEIRQLPTEVLPGHAAWIDGDYKLHRLAGKDGKAEYELYNLAQDTSEENNVADELPKKVEMLQAALDSWQHSVINSLNGGDYDSE